MGLLMYRVHGIVMKLLRCVQFVSATQCVLLVAHHMSRLYSVSCLMLSVILGMISATEFDTHSSFVRFLRFCWCAIVNLLLEIDIQCTFVVPNCKNTCGSVLNASIIKVMKEDGMQATCHHSSSVTPLLFLFGQPVGWQLCQLKSVVW